MLENVNTEKKSAISGIQPKLTHEKTAEVIAGMENNDLPKIDDFRENAFKEAYTTWITQGKPDNFTFKIDDDALCFAQAPYEFIHYTSAPVASLDLSRKYKQTNENFIFQKPKGLWLSVTCPNDWPSFCKENDYALQKLESKFKITLKKEANILYIDSEKAMTNFESEFGYYPPGIDRMGDNYILQMSVHWKNIIAQYQGIIIPFLINRQCCGHSLWYHVWDCTSGCIWDLSAIDKVEKIA